MNKKLIAAAVAGAFAAPAAVYAQANNIQIYGHIDLEYNYADLGQSATNAGGLVGEVRHTDKLTQLFSHIGFKGEENLGGGMAAWFQCESSLDPLAGGGTLCARNSALGLKGSFGNFFVGNWNTPYFQVSPLSGTSPFSSSGAFGYGDLLHNGIFVNVANDNAAAAASFGRRQQNLINYYTPIFRGFQVLAAVSAANEATAQTDGSTLGKRRLYSLGAIYNNGPIRIVGGYERHHDFNPANLPVNRTATGYSGRDDDAWQINGSYIFTPIRLKVGAAWTRNNFDVSNSAKMHYQAWGVYGSWVITGPHTLKFGYTKAQDTKGTAGSLAAPINVGSAVANGGAGNTKGELFALRYAYSLSKRTEVNAGAVYLHNDPNARYQLSLIGTRGVTGVPAGAVQQTGFQQRSFVLGIIHNF